MPPEAVLIFRGLRHDAVHIADLGLSRAPDDVVAERARELDAVLVTMDLHRQEAEWLAVVRQIAEARVRLLRVRLPRPPASGQLHLYVARQLIWRMEEWLLAFENGAALVTLGPPISRVTARTFGDVAEMLEGRQSLRHEF